MAFPTLNRRPKTVKVMPEENLLSSDMEAGYQHRRKKFTRERKKFDISYDLLSTADRDLIIAHFDTVGLHTSFNWTDLEAIVHTVFYDKAPAYVNSVPGWFQFETLELMEQ